MLPYFWYLLKVIICSGILFGYYWLFLRNKIFHQYNRFYLLAAMGLSLLLPLLKINFWQQGAQNNQAIRVLQAVSVGDDYMNGIVVSTHKSSWSIEQLYPLLYWLVSLVFLIVLLRTIYIIRTLLKQYPVQQVEEITFVNTDDDSTPFSFLKYIFWNSSIDMDTTTGRQIFKHEVAHIQEKHTYDKLFVNITLIFCWCNPFFWLYRKELNMIHEFIADKKAVEDSDTAAFAAMILQTAYPRHRFELTNNFFYSPIKRRLRMLTKIDNPRVSYFVRVMVLPLAILVFAAFTFKAKTNHSFYHGKKITVVIDAGHGGKDFGASGADGSLEKDLTLAFAKKVKELSNNNDLEIILTRDEDVYMTPMQKADFAKAKNADLFISFHVDGEPLTKVPKQSGMSFWVAKDEYANSGQSKILASAIINEFSKNYGLNIIDRINQRIGGVWILQATNCPAVLIETGFITNEKDVSYLKTDAAKETFAKNVLAAIEKYLTGNSIDPSSSIKDTLPTIAPSDLAPSASTNAVDTFDYYKQYGRATAYKGQKIKSVFIRKSDNKAIVEFVSGKKIIMPQEEVFKADILSAPPPPPPPPPGFYLNDQRPDSFRNKGLVIVDGVIQSDNYVIDNNNIVSVDVLKGNEAAAKYGEKGKYGVILITTKNVQQSADHDKADPENALYIINGKILGKGKAATAQANEIVAEKVYVKWLKKSEATAKYGKLGADGACELTITGGAKINNSVDVSVSDIAVGPESKIYLGSHSGGNISLSELKAQKDIMVAGGYYFYNAMVYFAGPGFENVVAVTLNSTSLAALQIYFNRCQEGTKIAFDNIYVKDKNGVSQKLPEPQTYIVGDNSFTGSSLQSNSNRNLNPITVEGKKSSEQEIALLKQKISLDQQNKAKTDDLAEKTVQGRKMTDQEIANLKQKMLIEQQKKAESDNKIFIKTETAPQFTGGTLAWSNYLYKNLKALTPVEEGWKAGKYTVMVKFIVHTDGTVSNVTTENYKNSKTAQEAIRVIQNSPPWIPATQNGIKVNAYHKQPITFLIED